MPQIETDFEVWKSLTLLRLSEEHTYNDVLRELLELPAHSSHFLEAVSVSTPPPQGGAPTLTVNAPEGLYSRGLFLPKGTQLKATYQAQQYFARVGDGVITNAHGDTFTSLSAAASAITGNNVNGWRFWDAKRPNDLSWTSLSLLL